MGPSLRGPGTRPAGDLWNTPATPLEGRKQCLPTTIHLQCAKSVEGRKLQTVSLTLIWKKACLEPLQGQILFFLSVTTASTSDLAVQSASKQKGQRDFFVGFLGGAKVLFCSIKAKQHKINTAHQIATLSLLAAESLPPNPVCSMEVKCGVHSVNIMTQNGTSLWHKVRTDGIRLLTAGPLTCKATYATRTRSRRKKEGRKVGRKTAGGRNTCIEADTVSHICVILPLLSLYSHYIRTMLCCSGVHNLNDCQ